MYGATFAFAVPPGQIGVSTPEIEIMVTNKQDAAGTFDGAYTLYYDPPPTTTAPTLAKISALAKAGT